MKTAKKQLARIVDYKRLFETPHGKNVLHDLMHTHGFMRTSFSSDPLQMAYNEGARSVVLRLLEILKVDIKQLEERIRDARETHFTGE